MIVRLTDSQLKACYAHATSAAKAWLDRGEPVGRVMIDVPMPPIGWRLLLDDLSAQAFNAYGQRKGRASGSLHRAVIRISRALARLEAHPAFRANSALPGEDDAVFLAWPTDPDGAISPYPTQWAPYLMVPHWRTVGGVRVTVWSGVVTFDHPDRLLQPAEHEAFVTA
ncbi:MAG: hypothetical protein K0Q89_9 [Thermomicrobiales bacterium]|jgi:hypothetical protein|nr:hypothetical protein [Thermomicrobiales bacterium]